MKPWKFKPFKRGKHGCEAITFFFQGRGLMRTLWYPPWQNDQMRENAKVICDDLNAAFRKRNKT